MAACKRQRSTSVAEECNVDAFVQSCLHFETNVTVLSSQAQGLAKAHEILRLLEEPSLVVVASPVQPREDPVRGLGENTRSSTHGTTTDAPPFGTALEGTLLDTQRSLEAGGLPSRVAAAGVEQGTTTKKNKKEGVKVQHYAALLLGTVAQLRLHLPAQDPLSSSSCLPGFTSLFPFIASDRLLEAVQSAYTADDAPTEATAVCRLLETHTTPTCQLRILCGIVPGEVSRHNCPARPEAITKLIQSALAKCAAGSQGLLIFSFAPAALIPSVTAAVARGAFKSFHAKLGNAERGYLKRSTPVELLFIAPNAPARLPDKQCEALQTLAWGIQLCQRLVQAPTNLLDTTTFAEIATSYATERLAQPGQHVVADVALGDALREQGYGGLFGVGDAAEYPPHLVTLSYRPSLPTEGAPHGVERRSVALVGEGIVYDTGGLSLKKQMAGASGDMGGAAAVLCSFLTLVRLQVPFPLSCVLCLADNAIGPNAQRPDDILRMKSGLTVELSNTDAAGCLVLGDGVYHATHELPFTPEVVIDMATLTGAQGQTTGRYHGAVYTNAEALEALLMTSGQQSGDLMFPVLYCPELHAPQFHSAVADMRNSVRTPRDASVSCTASFIERHLSSAFHGMWAHIDMTSASKWMGSPTGFGVALLCHALAPALFLTHET